MYAPIPWWRNARISRATTIPRPIHKGQVPMGLVVLKTRMALTEAELQQQLLTRFSSS